MLAVLNVKHGVGYALTLVGCIFRCFLLVYLSGNSGVCVVLTGANNRKAASVAIASAVIYTF